MATVTISPGFRIVLPREIRKGLDLKPGQKIQLFEYDGRIELIPVQPLKKMRGFLAGIDTTVNRELSRNDYRDSC